MVVEIMGPGAYAARLVLVDAVGRRRWRRKALFPLAHEVSRRPLDVARREAAEDDLRQLLELTGGCRGGRGGQGGRGRGGL